MCKYLILESYCTIEQVKETSLLHNLVEPYGCSRVFERLTIDNLNSVSVHIFVKYSNI